MRGEHILEYKDVVDYAGSSPHARGTHLRSSGTLTLTGIIPACAGNTVGALFSLLGIGDHPRMRGEHHWWGDPATKPTGSSPHARGTRLLASQDTRNTGIIPACAGNTYTGRERARFFGDHPRMRGEHMIKHNRIKSALGSSPHARGTLDIFLGFFHQFGIIPACAGNTRAAMYV